MTLVFALATPGFVKPFNTALRAELPSFNPYTCIFPNPWTLSKHRIQNTRFYLCLFKDIINRAEFMESKISSGLRNTWKGVVVTEFEVLSRHLIGRTE